MTISILRSTGPFRIFYYIFKYFFNIFFFSQFRYYLKIKKKNYIHKIYDNIHRVLINLHDSSMSRNGICYLMLPYISKISISW